jgi:hypothetical protein
MKYAAAFQERLNHSWRAVVTAYAAYWWYGVEQYLGEMSYECR